MNTYGVNEVNGLENPTEHHARYANAKSVCWTAPGLRVTRLRLLSDPGFPFWDVSYCQGELNGEPVTVLLPFSQLPKRGYRKAIVEWAKTEGVYALRLGILENISTLC